MSNKRITDLTELTTPTTDDVFPVVDIATNTTTKVQLGNLPVPNAVTTALATKQDTLVSGTNIKTLNNTSLLGSGNIVLTANPSGVAGAIQFSNGSAFASDAANLFWDDINNRLGVGTNVPTATGHFVGSGTTSATTALLVQNNSALIAFRVTNDAKSSFGGLGNNGYFGINRESDGSEMGSISTTGNGINIRGGASFINCNNNYSNTIGASSLALGAMWGIRGSGSTSATTSLLVQNSSAFTSLKTLDNGEVLIYPSTTYPTDTSFRSYQSGGLAVVGLISDRLTVTGGGANDTYIQGYGTFLHYERFRGLVINNSSSATLSTTPSALVEIQSTTQGFLPPKMTTTQKNAIATPAAGLVVYDSTTNKLQCYNGSTWNDLF